MHAALAASRFRQLNEGNDSDLRIRRIELIERWRGQIGIGNALPHRIIDVAGVIADLNRGSHPDRVADRVRASRTGGDIAGEIRAVAMSASGWRGANRIADRQVEPSQVAA